MTKKWAKDAAKKELPDVEIVEKPAKLTGAKQAEKPDRPGPSAKDLRRKYLGAEAAAASDSAGPDGGDDDEEDNDVEVMQVRNKNTSADPADDPGARALIVSKKKGILGSAG